MIRARFNRNQHKLTGKPEKGNKGMLFYDDDDEAMELEGFDDLDDELGDM